MVLMGEVVNTKEHNWIVNGTAGIGVTICVIMVKTKQWSDHQKTKHLQFLHVCWV